MSPSFQKNWYKKHNMTPPDENLEGPSAAAAKRIKVAPRKVIAAKPDSLRALNAARQQAYLAKGGRQPIGSMGSGGSNVMAGAGQSTIKDLKASIKAGFNPKVSLDPYESERAKKIGPRSLKMKKEEVQIDEALSPERKRMFDLKLKLIKKVANKKSYTKPSKVDEPRSSLNPSRDLKLQPKSLPTVAVGHYKEEVQIDEVTGYEGVKDRTDMIKRAAVMGRMGKNVFLARVKARAAELKKQKAMKEEVKDQADVGEYDYEGDMAKSQLRSILANAKRMHDMLEDNTNLPEWVQSKITLAEDYILTAANYMEGEMNEETEQIDEARFVTKTELKARENEKKLKTTDAYKKHVARIKKVSHLKKMVDEIHDNMQADFWRPKGGNKSNPIDDATHKRLLTRINSLKEEVEQVNEMYGGKVNGKRFDYDADPHELENDKKLHRVIASYNNHLDHDEVKAIVHSGGYSRNVKVGKNTHRVEHDDNEFNEEVVTEAEGTVAVTPKEKALAAHHGDKTKITFGDVLKARLKSAAAKAMNKGK